jgi:hypothetical protein
MWTTRFAGGEKDGPVLIDTDVLIWYMRGNEKALEWIEASTPFYISVITYMELVLGMRYKQELTALRTALREWQANILYIHEEISTKAMFFIENHYLSHSLEIADSLIAATAVVNALPLMTGNNKHYRCTNDLDLNLFRP